MREPVQPVQRDDISRVGGGHPMARVREETSAKRMDSLQIYAMVFVVRKPIHQSTMRDETLRSES